MFDPFFSGLSGRAVSCLAAGYEALDSVAFHRRLFKVCIRSRAGLEKGFFAIVSL